MPWIAQLLHPRRRKNQEELAGRAAEVIAQVLADVGVDSFRQGTLLVDRDFRLRFVSGLPGPVLAAVPVASLAEARALPRELHDSRLGRRLLRQRVKLLVAELMAALLAQSATLRGLPVKRYRMPERSAAASK